MRDIWNNRRTVGTGSDASIRQDANVAAEPRAAGEGPGISSPAISLPKGGGAIRGIDEKFTVNPATGTASLSIPLFTSPGRSDFDPKLTLAGDSGSGNGAFGIGWNLPIPSISRKTDKGIPKYQDAEESDTFILSGAEDLVPILIQDGQEWQPDMRPEGDYLVRRYRPRVEGLFARIERWQHRQNGDVYWKSVSKDNITSIYGKSPAARIADPENPTRIFQWLLEESHDDRGNIIHYQYKQENLQNVDPSLPQERNRLAYGIGFANRYIKRIQYGNCTPFQPGGWLFEVVFDYGEHDLKAPRIGEDQAWPCRQDPFSTYRAGFEIRTYRLCRRVLMFHHFEELGNTPCLVRSTDFTYEEGPVVTYLQAVQLSGYVREQGGQYLKKSFPPLEFTYTRPEINPLVQELPLESLEHLPAGLGEVRHQWVDLDGEGLNGFLMEQPDAWLYKRNLGHGRFGPAERIAATPSLASLTRGGQQILDLAGDGQKDLVLLSEPLTGFYEHEEAGRWAPFTPFQSVPNVDWRDPNLRFIDLNGDGLADLLLSEHAVFVWYPSKGEQGFGAAGHVLKPMDEEKGPTLVFADATESVYLADMSGDGMADIVRIRNGEVCYWPNLGYGRFGPKITMDDAPYFDTPDLFDQRQIRLADIDGSGTTDIFYIERNRLRFWFNQSGNHWSEGYALTSIPQTDNLTSVTVIDLLGNGTACIVWSSPLPRDAAHPMHYIDLMGGKKPHLLQSVKDNLGAETRIEYAASTKFYLEDREAGEPWITRLPFPVHVVERVETYDWISKNRFVTRYAYHHGYYDGDEREFRGFGMVEQWDTAEFTVLSSSNAFPGDTNIDASSHVPPVRTKTWFHTGAYVQGARISLQFKDDYYREPGLTDPQFDTLLLPDTILPSGLSPQEEHEACRALKGSILRQEIFGLDGSDKSKHPYTVSERNYTIQTLQPIEKNRHAVFFVHPRETIDFHYERNPKDPRVSHQMTLKVDEFGNVERTIAIGYPRRQVPGHRPEQAETHLTLTVNRFVNRADPADWYRVGLPVESRTYEIVRPPLPVWADGIVQPFQFEDIRTLTEGLFPLGQIEPEATKTLPYERWDWRRDPHTPLETRLRLIELVRTLYRRNDLTGPLPLDQVESLALPFETYQLAFTPALISQVHKRSRNGQEEDLLPNPASVLGKEGGYIDLDGNGHWWIPSGKVFYWRDKQNDPAAEFTFAKGHFFLPHRFEDPFGNSTIVAYDKAPNGQEYNLLVTSTQDPVGNEVRAAHDYRALQPRVVIDPNHNHTEVIFDPLGMVVGTAVKGKVSQTGQSESGDSLQGFMPDLTDAQLTAFMNAPGQEAPALLGNATTRIVYDLESFQKSGQPAFAATIARENHVNAPHGAPSPVQISFSYSDGFGREIQKKIQAEPETPGGPLRWVGSGWTIFNNKGKPVQQYEPFFSPTHRFEFAKRVGVSPILFYDPLERVVATLHPNHTYEKVLFDPWRQETWDVNDTLHPETRFDLRYPNVLPDHTFDPANDPNVGHYFKRLPQADYLPTWYDLRVDPAKALTEWPDQDANGNPIPENASIRAAEKKAAQRAARHAATPTVAHLDSLGRSFLTVTDNGRDENGIDQSFETRIQLDIEGNQRAVIDAKDRIVMRYDYDLLGNRIHQFSMDAGRRWLLNNVAGNPIRTWDSLDHQVRQVYDPLQRPTYVYVQRGNGAEALVERMVYGEMHPDANPPAPGVAAPNRLNLRRQLYQHFDGAGVVTNVGLNPATNAEEAYDFKGNLLRSTRRLAEKYDQTVDWWPLAKLNTIEAIANAVEPLLEKNESFVTGTDYDALNRPIRQTTPDASEVRLTYNEANLLDRVDVAVCGGAERPFVRNIDYNAKGQRTRIDYAIEGPNAVNAVIRTTYEYDDKTFRLINLKTIRTTDNARLQDLCYTYDPVGNIAAIRDEMQQTLYFNNQVVSPHSEYLYDATYRLIGAERREHIGQLANPQPNHDDAPRMNQPHPTDGQAMRRYVEEYEYDEVGNILRMMHSLGGLAHPGQTLWHRRYRYDESSLIEPSKQNNRLSSTSLPGDDPLGPYSAPYGYDAHGNMIRMPHLPEIEWNYEDQMHRVDLAGGGAVYFVYDAAGDRVRKVHEHNGATVEERIYLGNYEIYRKRNGSGLQLERETLHIMDDERRIALVETKTRDQGAAVPDPESLIRYQLDNHLGSACLELGGEGKILSYEEYHPYGTTAYQAVHAGIEQERRPRKGLIPPQSA